MRGAKRRDATRKDRKAGDIAEITPGEAGGGADTVRSDAMPLFNAIRYALSLLMMMPASAPTRCADVDERAT